MHIKLRCLAIDLAVTISQSTFRKVPFRKVPFGKVPFRKVPFRFANYRNANNCIIHITKLDFNKPQGTTITPTFRDNCSRVIFIGYINELHYVSTVHDKNSPNSTRLANLKRTLSQSSDKRGHSLLKEEKG